MFIEDREPDPRLHHYHSDSEDHVTSNTRPTHKDEVVVSEEEEEVDMEELKSAKTKRKTALRKV